MRATSNNDSGKRYAIDRRERGSYTNHNGHAEGFDYWRQIAEVTAARAGKALQLASQKWPGTELRARQLCGGGFQ